MFSTIRKRVTYTNVVVTIALVFAMSGGAYAAGKYLITSTKQISPKVLKALKGQNGKAGAPGVTGPVGPTGPAGPAGATGPAGKEGPTGKEGPVGEVGPTGPKGETGKDGTTGFTETLPSGKTETGVWGVAAVPGSFAGGALELAVSSISFAIPLKAGLEKGKVHVISVGGTGTGAGSGCPAGSSVAKPGAEAGNLCIFLSSPEVNVGGEIQTRSLETEEEGEVGTTGALVDITPEAAKEPILASGVWAVTAP